MRWVRVTIPTAVALFVLALVPETAFAAEDGGSNWGIAIGAGLAIGLAGLGCGIGQGLAASGANRDRMVRSTRHRPE